MLKTTKERLYEKLKVTKTLLDPIFAKEKKIISTSNFLSRP